MINKAIKKMLLAVIAASFVFSSVTAWANESVFTDMETEHWAYADVLQLVEAGTISGYPTGEFKPGATVTRAEFTKMIGGGTQSGRSFADVAETHWVYSYAAKSDLKADENNNFNPDTPITRGDTVYPMYAKAGKPAPDMSKVPDHIKAQGGEELWWIYSTGVMVGNDGVDLRLGDTLTRAEAAALIMKADRAAVAKEADKKTEVKKTDDVLEYVYGAANIFDTPYSKDAKITYGEMAKASLRMAQSSFDLNYDYYYCQKPFEHKYAVDLYVLSKGELGTEKLTETGIDTNVTIGDAIICFNEAIKRRISRKPDFKPEIKAGRKESDEITHSELAEFIIQYDEKYGLVNGYLPGVDEFGKVIPETNRMVKDLAKLPEAYENYTYIVEGIPAEVYVIDGEVKGTPKDTTNFATTFSEMFSTRCGTLEKMIKDEYKQDAVVVFYPSLTYDSGSGFTTTVKVEVKNDNGNIHNAAEMFGNVLVSCSTGDEVKTGSVVYVKMVIDGYLA